MDIVEFNADRGNQQAAENLTYNTEVQVDVGTGSWAFEEDTIYFMVWPSDSTYHNSETYLNNWIGPTNITPTWKYKVPSPSGTDSWIEMGTTGTHTIYKVFGEKKCADTDYTAINIQNAVEKALSQSTESDIASSANSNVSRNIYEGCICSSGFQVNFDAAMGTFPPPPPPPTNKRGMCCCRAEGLNCVLEVLGIGSYTHVYCNEKPESTWGTSTHWCGGICSNHGNVERRYAGGAYIWEGAIRSGGSGTTCYAPGVGVGGTPYETTYDGIASDGVYKWYRWAPPTGPWIACTGSCSVTGDSQYGCNNHSSWWGRFD
ncbi:MAG: hypothetical protein A2173_10970 [Planctomycetes bacterium RBG_13_44_8b]|nr:MAG: hypothetical protein A2173_10970 [Planctomycetes bacterium RBG_13_44_8b]